MDIHTCKSRKQIKRGNHLFTIVDRTSSSFKIRSFGFIFFAYNADRYSFSMENNKRIFLVDDDGGDDDEDGDRQHEITNRIILFISGPLSWCLASGR